MIGINSIEVYIKWNVWPRRQGANKVGKEAIPHTLQRAMNCSGVLKIWSLKAMKTATDLYMMNINISEASILSRNQKWTNKNEVDENKKDAVLWIHLIAGLGPMRDSLWENLTLTMHDRNVGVENENIFMSKSIQIRVFSSIYCLALFSYASFYIY